MAESPLPLTPAQRAHYELMRSIAARLVDTPLILKGGTALLLCYASDRFSRDLDFDSTKKLNLESRILSSFPEGVEAVALDKLKDTKTVTRYRLTYRKDGVEQSLKIEVSHRDTLDPSNTVVREGVRTYSPSRLIEQKLATIELISGPTGRTAPRDLYDVAFLASHFPDAFEGSAVRKLHYLTDHLADVDSQYRPAFEEDKDILTVGGNSGIEGILIRLLDAREAVDRALAASAVNDLLAESPQEQSDGPTIS